MNLIKTWAEGHPMEFWLLVVCGGTLLILLTCYWIAAEDPRPPRAGRPFLTGGLAVIGLLGIAYFLLFFDVGVVAPTGERVANLDLVSQRQNGIIVSCALFVVGALVQLFRRHKEPTGNPFDR